MTDSLIIQVDASNASEALSFDFSVEGENMHVPFT